MEETVLFRGRNTLKLRYEVQHNHQNMLNMTVDGSEHVITGDVVFAMKVNNSYNHNLSGLFVTQQQTPQSFIFVKFTNKKHDDKLYTMKFTCPEFGIANKTFITDDGTWRLVHENKTLSFTFDVSVQMDTAPGTNLRSFAILHDDVELTDFELRGEDGAVRMHRAVLAAASPVLRGMFGGSWKETTEGHVDVPGTSKVTLQHLKDYVYLHRLPNFGLEQLLLLASYYIMPDLEKMCVSKLADSVTAQNACDLTEFAVKHKATKLLLAVFEVVQSGGIKVSEMRNHLFPDDDNVEE